MMIPFLYGKRSITTAIDMKANSSSNSVAIRLAALVTLGYLVCAGGESTNALSKYEMQLNLANPKMIYGEATNFIRGDVNAGLSAGGILRPLLTSLRVGIDARNSGNSNGLIILSGTPLAVLCPADLYVFSALESPHWIWVGVPPFNESVMLSMTDSNNVQVPMTPNGLALGRPLALRQKTTWSHWGGNNRHPWFIAPYWLLTIGTRQEKYAGPRHFIVDPTQYFAINSPGSYELTITVRLYIVDTNTYLKPITLPPVTVPVRVK